MKYLLIFFNRGMPHSCNGAQILTWDEKLHTDGGSIQQVFFDVKLFFSLVGDLLANLYNIDEFVKSRIHHVLSVTCYVLGFDN